MKFSVFHTRYILFGLLVTAVAAELLLLSVTDTAMPAARSLDRAAAEVFAVCSDAPHRPTCYEQEVPKLLSSISMEDAFVVVRRIQQTDPSYRFCHVLGHKLGEQEVAKDPTNWFDVIPRCPSDGLCSNGCIHGAAVERFNKEVFSDEEIEAAIPDLKRACEAREGYNPTPLDQAICYHGIGHMNVHLTSARVEKSLEICDRVAVKEDGRDFERVCDEGVFMQLFQPLEPEDFALVEQLPVQPTKENLAQFCKDNGRDAEEAAACWREGWPFYSQEMHTPEGLTAFCDTGMGIEAENRCYDTTLSIIGRSSLDDPDAASRLCSGLAAARQAQCFAIAAGAILEEDRTQGPAAAAFCGNAPTESNREACYDRLTSTATFVFHPTDPKLRELCSALPTPWHDRCVAQERR